MNRTVMATVALLLSAGLVNVASAAPAARSGGILGLNQMGANAGGSAAGRLLMLPQLRTIAVGKLPGLEPQSMARASTSSPLPGLLLLDGALDNTLGAIGTKLSPAANQLLPLIINAPGQLDNLVPGLTPLVTGVLDKGFVVLTPILSQLPK
jgi:hypothetical protein